MADPYQDPFAELQSSCVEALNFALEAWARIRTRLNELYLMDEPDAGDVHTEIQRLERNGHATEVAVAELARRLDALEENRRTYGVPSVVTFALMPPMAQGLVRRSLARRMRPLVRAVAPAAAPRRTARRRRASGRRSARAPGRDADPEPAASPSTLAELAAAAHLTRREAHRAVAALLASAYRDRDARLRTCSVCDLDLPLDAFRLQASGYHESQCTACKARGKREARARKKAVAA